MNKEDILKQIDSLTASDVDEYMRLSKLYTNITDKEDQEELRKKNPLITETYKIPKNIK